MHVKPFESAHVFSLCSTHAQHAIRRPEFVEIVVTLRLQPLIYRHVDAVHTDHVTDTGNRAQPESLFPAFATPTYNQHPNSLRLVQQMSNYQSLSVLHSMLSACRLESSVELTGGGIESLEVLTKVVAASLQFGKALLLVKRLHTWGPHHVGMAPVATRPST